jgi:hypothetical protein
MRLEGSCAAVGDHLQGANTSNWNMSLPASVLAGARQPPRTRNNLFDLYNAAVVDNLHVIACQSGADSLAIT